MLQRRMRMLYARALQIKGCPKGHATFETPSFIQVFVTALIVCRICLYRIYLDIGK